MPKSSKQKQQDYRDRQIAKRDNDGRVDYRYPKGIYPKYKDRIDKIIDKLMGLK